MDKHTPWHRLLGMALTDLLTGRPWRGELETELTLKSQRLDLLIIESDPGAAPLPDPDALSGATAASGRNGQAQGPAPTDPL